MKDLGVSARYAHSDGYTSVCYTKDDSKLITGGSDGDIRVWGSITEDEPVTHRAGDVVHALTFGANHYYVATNDNDIQKRTYPDGDLDGTPLRFTGTVTCMCMSADNSVLYAGASDFEIKYINESNGETSVLSGHEAPVLCVLPHPKDLLVSASCDGTIRVWDLTTNKIVKTFLLVPKSNDFSLSNTYCQMTWSKDLKQLLIPVGKTVEIYSVSDWSKVSTLQHDSIEQNVDIVRVSPCGSYVAVGCRDGMLLIWSLATKQPVSSYENFRKHGITGLTWNPAGNQEVVITDAQGNLGLFDDVLPDDVNIKKAAIEEESDEAVTADDLFDDIDGMDDEMLAATADDDQGSDGEANMDEVEKLLFDENSKDSTAIGADAGDSGPAVPAPHPQVVVPEVFMQPPFQPGSTPLHLSHRFMLWNSVGIIRQYNTDEENSVDVEFHDTSTHHAIHINNSAGYTMAALSDQVVALAAEADGDVNSVLACTMLNTQDSGKQWSMSMPDGEDIMSVSAGRGWVCVVTSLWYIRLYSTSGIQLAVISLPGPVVCSAGNNLHLMVVYHRGSGIPDCQSLGVQLINVGKHRQTLAQGDLPLAPKATLVWLGFTAEGSPISVDSTGRVLMLKRRAGCTWLPICDTKLQLSGRSDNYWIVSVHEQSSQIRSVLCKSSKFPATLPRPVLSVVPLQIPLCDTETEKTAIESTYWSSLTLLENSIPSADDLETEELRNSMLMTQQEALIKLFALSCKSGLERRAYDICEMMPTSHSVQLAIKYATRLRRLQLAEQLSELAHRLAETEASGVDNQEVDDWAAPQPPEQIAQTQRITESDDDDQEDNVDMTDGLVEDSAMDGEAPRLLIKSKSDPTKTIQGISTGSQQKVNPFKKSSSTTLPRRGSQVFDTVNSKPKPVMLGGSGKSKLLAVKKTQRKEKSKTQENPSEPSKTGFQLWFEENRSEVIEKHGDGEDDSAITIAAAKMFKQLPADEKKEWHNKAKQSPSVDSESDRKRKRASENLSDFVERPINKQPNTQEPVKKKKPLSASNKLAGFAFSKDS